MLLKSLIIPTTLLLITANLCLASGDERLTITLAYSNEVDSTRVWPHMSDTQRENILLMHALTHSELRSLGMYKINTRWEFGGRFRYVTGSPRTPFKGSLYSSDTDTFEPVSGPTNSERVAPFHQLDL